MRFTGARLCALFRINVAVFAGCPVGVVAPAARHPARSELGAVEMQNSSSSGL